MSTTTKIIIAVGIVVAVIILRWFLQRGRPRLHHYIFGHGLLPNVVLSEPDQVLSILLSPTGHSREGDNFLVQLWLEASKELPPSKHLPASGLTYKMEVLHSPRSAVHIVQMPEPEKPLECYFAAIVFDSVAFAAQRPAGVRYFTLERSISGGSRIGESRFSPNGAMEQMDHGECPATDKEAFISKLRTLVTDNSNPDESFSELAMPGLAKLDRGSIVPRIKHTNFLAAFKQLNPKPEETPLTEPLVGDLLVTYAFDLPGAFQMFSSGDMKELGMTPGEVRATAIANLRKQVPQVRAEDMSPLHMLVTGNDLEACLLLLDDIWEPYARKVSGEMVVAVPARDMVLLTGSKSPEGMQVIREAVAEAHKDASTHSLTQHLLTRRNGKWEIFQ